MNIFKHAAVFICTLSFSFSASSQHVYTGQQAAARFAGADVVRTSKFSDAPSYIHFEKGNEIAFADWKNWVKENFALGFQYNFTLLNTNRDKLSHTHYRMQQTVNGNPVENSMWIVHTQNGKVYSMNGLVFTNVNVSSAVLTQTIALAAALQHVGAQQYKWELPEEEENIKLESGNANATYYPIGEMVYIHEKNNPSQNKLAFKFNIYAHSPVGRWYVYVDAVTGKILNKKQILHDADTPGTAVTAYSGNQTIIADSFGGTFRLRETGRGDGIRTYDMQTGTSYGAAVDFTDADNMWNNVNAAQDQYATDAHWGAEMTYDYYMQEHNRNSIDDAGFALLSYVHYDVNYDNAFWDGQRMTYGDGNVYNPFTALDITGHEITHGLCEFTANLDYQDESGALNESFSDIFGTCIEWFGKPAMANWLMGENIGGALRSMSNPASYGDPDTYFGNNWAPLGGADNGGVHTNSGVQNFWFYLLSQGGSGTNDNGDAYSVTGLGMSDASSIAFRNLTVYLTNTSQYDDARFYAIQSAVDLFGGCTPEVEATTNAWYAVGVGPAYVATVTAAFVPNTIGGCANPLTVNFSNASNNGVSYTWDFGDGGTSTQTNPAHTYTVNGVYTVQLIADGGLCGIDTTVVTNQIYVGQMPNPVVSDGGRCDAGTVTLSATGNGTLSWFTAPTGGSPIATGNTYTTPSISSTTTYYVEAATGGTQNLGPLNNSVGAGGYTTSDRWLIFDAQQPFVLNSVWVFANGAGNRTIELRNSAGGVLQSTTVNLPNGGSTVTLNFNVPVGTDLQLGTIAGTQSNLYRNSAGINYPYSITGTVDITGSNGGAAYYYYFYNWQITTDPCTSTRVPVVAAIASAPTTVDDSRCGPGNVTLSATGTTGTLNWFTAPTGGTLVNTGPAYTVPLATTTSYYVEEQMPAAPEYVGAADNTFGGGGYFNGDQHLVFDVTANCVLKSVLVYANGAGNRTVELRNSAGGVLQSAVVNIPNGQNRITLNFNLTPGTDFQLGWANGSAPDLYRNNTGTPAYPYSLAGGEVVITTSSPGTGYYYAYYDWEIELPGCVTARTQVTGNINTAFDASITPVGPFCSSDSPVNLTAVDPGGVWTGTGITNGTTGTFDPITAGTGTHAIVYSISGTCGDDDTLNVVVTNTFDATITTTSTICTGAGMVNLTAVDPGGVWSGTGIVNAATGQFDPIVAGAGIHTITYSISGACGASDNENVTVETSMDATIATVSTLCVSAAPVTLTATDAGGTWSGTGVTGNTFNPTTAGPGSHTVTYTISGACGDTDTETIMVHPIPNATITPPTGVVCQSMSNVPMTGAQTGGTWSATCGGCISTFSGIFNPAFAGVGNYNIFYTVTNTCGTDVDTLPLTVQNCSGINEIQSGFSIQLVPNPADEGFYIMIENALSTRMHIEMHNTLGQVVYASNQNIVANRAMVPAEHLTPGVYLVHVLIDNQRVTARMVIK